VDGGVVAVASAVLAPPDDVDPRGDDLAAVDRLALADEDASARLSIDLPENVAGTSYRMDFGQPGPESTINLSTNDPGVETTVTMKLNTTMTPRTLSGGDVVLVYNGTALEVQRA
jgi:hypothetical protein